MPLTRSYSITVWTRGFYWRHLKRSVKSTGRPPSWLRVRNPGLGRARVPRAVRPGTTAAEPAI